MDLRIQLSAHVDKSGQLMIDEPVRWRAWLATAQGKRVTVTLERQRSRRSSEANRRYWAALVPFVQEVLEQRTGQPFTKDSAHLFLKLAFAGHVEVVMVGGQVVTLPRSTAKMSTPEFQKYCQRIEAWIEQEFKVKPELIDMEANL